MFVLWFNSVQKAACGWKNTLPDLIIISLRSDRVNEHVKLNVEVVYVSVATAFATNLVAATNLQVHYRRLVAAPWWRAAAPWWQRRRRRCWTSRLWYGGLWRWLWVEPTKLARHPWPGFGGCFNQDRQALRWCWQHVRRLMWPAAIFQQPCKFVCRCHKQQMQHTLNTTKRQAWAFKNDRAPCGSVVFLIELSSRAKLSVQVIELRAGRWLFW